MMDKKTFILFQLIYIVFFQTPHAAVVYVRILVGPSALFNSSMLNLTVVESELLYMEEYKLGILFAKLALYLMFILTCWCFCYCWSKCGLFFHTILIVFSCMLSVSCCIFPITEIYDGRLPAGTALSLEIAFYTCVLIMFLLDLYAFMVFRNAMRLKLYNSVEVTRVNAEENAPIFTSYSNSANYNSYARLPPPPPYTEQRAPPTRRLTRIQNVPYNLQAAHLRDSEGVYSDGEGGFILIRNVTASLSTFQHPQAQHTTVERTQVAWITADAILRNPSNPEVLILTATEISHLDLGEDRHLVRQALQY